MYNRHVNPSELVTVAQLTTAQHSLLLSLHAMYGDERTGDPMMDDLSIMAITWNEQTEQLNYLFTARPEAQRCQVTPYVVNVGAAAAAAEGSDS